MESPLAVPNGMNLSTLRAVQPTAKRDRKNTALEQIMLFAVLIGEATVVLPFSRLSTQLTILNTVQ